MLYLIIEKFKANKRKELYLEFKHRGRRIPDGLNYINSWVDKDLKCCYQLMETSKESLLHNWISQWEDYADFKIVPVITSKEAAEQILGFTDQ